MKTEELLDYAKSGTLTEEEYMLVLGELKARGVPASELPTRTDHSSASDNPENGFFWRCWHGKERLWKAFWLLGLLSAIIFKLTEIPSSQQVQAILVLIVFLPIQVFWWVSVWRCAFRSSHWGWAILARAHVIVTILISCVVILGALT